MPTRTAADVRTVVAENLRRLMERAREQGRLELASNLQLGTTTGVAPSAINLYVRGEASIGVDQLARLATAFELQPWELLYPGLNPTAPPAVQIIAMHRLARGLSETLNDASPVD